MSGALGWSSGQGFLAAAVMATLVVSPSTEYRPARPDFGFVAVRVVPPPPAA
jgi:hypothetical protein